MHISASSLVSGSTTAVIKGHVPLAPPVVFFFLDVDAFDGEVNTDHYPFDWRVAHPILRLPATKETFPVLGETD